MPIRDLWVLVRAERRAQASATRYRPTYTGYTDCSITTAPYFLIHEFDDPLRLPEPKQQHLILPAIGVKNKMNIPIFCKRRRYFIKRIIRDIQRQRYVSGGKRIGDLYRDQQHFVREYKQVALTEFQPPEIQQQLRFTADTQQYRHAVYLYRLAVSLDQVGRACGIFLAGRTE